MQEAGEELPSQKEQHVQMPHREKTGVLQALKEGRLAGEVRGERPVYS